MPGSTPPTSQLDWLSSTTAMIVLFWSRATRDLLKSFGWGIAALHRLDAATKLPFPRRPPHSIFRFRTRGAKAWPSSVASWAFFSARNCSALRARSGLTPLRGDNQRGCVGRDCPKLVVDRSAAIAVDWRKPLAL